MNFTHKTWTKLQFQHPFLWYIPLQSWCQSPVTQWNASGIISVANIKPTTVWVSRCFKWAWTHRQDSRRWCSPWFMWIYAIFQDLDKRSAKPHSFNRSWRIQHSFRIQQLPVCFKPTSNKCMLSSFNDYVLWQFSWSTSDSIPLYHWDLSPLM